MTTETDASVNSNNNPNDVPSYHNYKRVLLLGEADFSFARAFARNFLSEKSKKDFSADENGNELYNSDEQHGHHSRGIIDMEITATEYGSGSDIAERYHNGNKEELRASMDSLSNLIPVKEIICGLNARHLGNVWTNDATASNKTYGPMCQRWNKEEHDWDPPSPFWEKSRDTMNLNNEFNDAPVDVNAVLNNGNENDANAKNNSTFFDLIIFNFPHSEQAGRATKLVMALFKQIRICINDGRLPRTVVLEMRLRFVETNPAWKKNIRSFYHHEESALENQFELIGSPWSSDLQRWEALGYSHKWTKRNATCRDIGLLCKVWRWQSAV